MVLAPDNSIIAHTFNNKPPLSLVNANRVPERDSWGIKIIHSIDGEQPVIRDFALPILENRLGTLRIGFSEASINNQIKQTSRLFIILVFGLLALGILAAFFLSYIISEPVKKMSYQVSQINLRSLETRDYGINLKTGNPILRFKNIFRLTDEIDVLVNSFNSMLFRLNVAYMELEQTRESLSQTEKLASVGTLAAGLAHEINNPLAGMSNALRRIADKPENIRQNKEYLEMMSEAIERISNVVSGLLDFSRKHEMNCRRMDLVQHIENSIALLSFQLGQSHILVDKNFESEEIMIDGSPNHLEQVFVNVLLNSIDAINERRLNGFNGEGRISIDIFKVDKEIKITFTDNGIGLAKEKIPLMFDSFFTEKTVKQGTGLGLAVSKDIIKNHYGQISGRSINSEGFIIEIVLPDKITLPDNHAFNRNKNV
jgi:signal transduction histidine kinase